MAAVTSTGLTVNGTITNTGIATLGGTGFAKRKIVLSQLAGNDHQFNGVGTTSDGQIYQVSNNLSSHIFYSGVNSASSFEQFKYYLINPRITNDGCYITGNAISKRKIVTFTVGANEHQFNGIGITTEGQIYQVTIQCNISSQTQRGPIFSMQLQGIHLVSSSFGTSNS